MSRVMRLFAGVRTMRKRFIGAATIAGWALALSFGSTPTAKAATYTSLSAYNAGETLSTTITGYAGLDGTGAVVSLTSFFAATAPDQPTNSSLATVNTYLVSHGFPGTLSYQSPGSVPGDLQSGTVSIDDFSGGSFPARLWLLKFDGNSPGGATIALLFSAAVSSVSFSGFATALSHFDLGFVPNPATDPVPLPPAALLFGSVLVGAAIWRRRRAKKLAV